MSEFSRHDPRERRRPAERTGHRIIQLLTLEGQAAFRDAMRASGHHTAAVIIHPFPDDYTGPGSVIAAYKHDLRADLERDYPNVPVILFEKRRFLPQIDVILKEMGVYDRQIFLVPTEDLTPRPVDRELDTFAGELAALGLRDATVMGSYLRVPAGFHQPREFSAGTTPILFRCVGETIKAFVQSGITARYARTISPDGWSTS